MHALVSKLVALSIENYYMAFTKMKLKIYVGFMAPVAKRFPTTLVAYQNNKGKNLNTVQACAAAGKNLRKCCIRQFVGRLLILQFSRILDQKQFIFAILIRVLIAQKSKLGLDPTKIWRQLIHGKSPL